MALRFYILHIKKKMIKKPEKTRSSFKIKNKDIEGIENI